MGIQGGVDDWRKDMLEVLKRLESRGITKVAWSTAGDEHVCSLCRARNGKSYTIKELEGNFCKPGDPDDRCRCTFYGTKLKKDKKQTGGFTDRGDGFNKMS